MTEDVTVASRGRRRAPSPSDRPEFIGRYALGEKLGEGSSGAVYRAIDRDRGLPVAVKLLHSFEPAQLAAFKAEFRIASACAGPELVSCFELIEQERTWGIAMELVDGPPLMRYLGLDEPGTEEHAARVRRALRDVVSGLRILHGAGVVHRDLKPSNLLVTAEGGVRIADFGLAKLFEVTDPGDLEGFIVGTPDYMAPEQAMGGRPGPPADLYAVGVILYEALTRELPWRGDSVLLAKNVRDAPDPARLAPRAPADLLDVTRRLLSRRAEERPTLDELARVFEGPPEGAPMSSRPASSGLVGRGEELVALARAFDASATGGPVLVQVSGPSGVGKSALVRVAAAALERERGATVLAGRCHELESIPHKGFDQIVDLLRGDLARALLQGELSGEALSYVRDAARMFPVLEDLLPEGALPPQSHLGEQARRAREAIPRLLALLPSAVVILDDVQWGDAEGGRLVEAILAASPPCVRLLVLMYRDTEAAGSALLQHLASLPRDASPWRALTLRLSALAPDDAVALARRILGSDAAARSVAEEAQGHPFFIEQLALAGLKDDVERVTVEEVVHRRARAFGPEGQRLVEVVALSGAPLPESLVTGAAEVSDARRLLNELVVASLLRRSGAGPGALVDTYHDRIRSGLVGRVPSERRRQIQGKVAALGEAAGSLQPARLSRLFEEAGHVERATLHALTAGRAAEEALAFDAAAAMYERVIRLSSDAATVQEARCARARALFVAGRCDAAGTAFTAAAVHADGARAAELQRQAVEAFLAFGHVAEALAIFVPLLERARLPYPTTLGAALLSLFRAAAEVKLRARARPVTGRSVDPVMAERSDLAWSGKGLLNVAPTQGIVLTLWSLCFALRSGSAFRIARGLGIVGSGFVPGFVRVGERYLRWANELAEELDDDHLRTWYWVASGARAFILGRFGECLRCCQEGLRIAATTPAPTHWEEAIAGTLLCSAFEYLGQFREMEASAREQLRTLRGQGDRITEVMLVSALGYPLAARHDAAGLDAVIVDMQRRMADWSIDYPFWESFRWRLRCLRALCWGDARGALDLVEAEWPRMKALRLLDLPFVRHPVTCVRSAVLLEAVAQGLTGRRAAFATVRADARRLSRAPRAEGPAAAQICHAAMAHLEGRHARRDAHLTRAAEIARAGDMHAVERMARRALALCRGDTRTVARLDGELDALGVTEPDAWARFVTPALCPEPSRRNARP